MNRAALIVLACLAISASDVRAQTEEPIAAEAAESAATSLQYQLNDDEAILIAQRPEIEEQIELTILQGTVVEDPTANVDAYLAGDCQSCQVCSECATGCDCWGWSVLPTGVIYKSYLAGVKESRLGLVINHTADNVDDAGYMFDGTLGGRVGILRYGNCDPFFPLGFQMDVEASAQVRLSFEEEMDVQATDYRVGVPFTYGWENKQIKFAYYHLSSHIGDEFFQKNLGFQRLNYARDALVLGYSQYMNEDLRVYAEASWAFFSDVAEPWEFQFGFDYAPACPTGICGAPFVAANVYLREEVEFGGNFVAQAGWAWRGDANARLFRVGVHYYNGKSQQFSFFNEHEHQIGVGIWYDY